MLIFNIQKEYKIEKEKEKKELAYYIILYISKIYKYINKNTF